MTIRFQSFHQPNSFMMKSVRFYMSGEKNDLALSTYRAQLEDLKTLYHQPENKEIQVVLLGHPFTILTPQMNKGIPDYLSSLGMKVFYQDMIPDNEDLKSAITPLLDEIHWNYAAKIIESQNKPI